MSQPSPPSLKVPSSTAATAGMWTLSLATLGVAGLLASSFALMAASLDPAEMISAGIEPWTNAAEAAAGFAALVATTAVALFLWHSARFRALGLIVAVLQACAVAWASLQFFNEYF